MFGCSRKDAFFGGGNFKFVLIIQHFNCLCEVPCNVNGSSKIYINQIFYNVAFYVNVMKVLGINGCGWLNVAHDASVVFLENGKISLKVPFFFFFYGFFK